MFEGYKQRRERLIDLTANQKRSFVHRNPTAMKFGRSTPLVTLAEAIKAHTHCYDAPSGKLTLVNCHIKCFTPIPNRQIAIGATQVYLSGNEFRSLTGLDLAFRQCPLRVLSLGSNGIRSLKDVEVLASLRPTLQILNLENNPLSAMPFYRYHVVAAVPALKTLDGKDVSSSERNNAKDILRKERTYIISIVNQKIWLSLILNCRDRIHFHNELKRKVPLFGRGGQHVPPVRFHTTLFLRVMAPIAAAAISRDHEVHELRRMVWQCGVVRFLVNGVNNVETLTDEQWFHGYANVLSQVQEASVEAWSQLQRVSGAIGKETYEDVIDQWHHELERSSLVIQNESMIPENATSQPTVPQQKKKLVKRVVFKEEQTPPNRKHHSHDRRGPQGATSRAHHHEVTEGDSAPPAASCSSQPSAEVTHNVSSVEELEQESTISRLYERSLSPVANSQIPVPHCAPSPLQASPLKRLTEFPPEPHREDVDEVAIGEALRNAHEEIRAAREERAILQRSVLQQHSEILRYENQIETLLMRLHQQQDCYDTYKGLAQREHRKLLMAIDLSERSLLRKVFHAFRSGCWISSRHRVGMSLLEHTSQRFALRRIFCAWRYNACSSHDNIVRHLRYLCNRRCVRTLFSIWRQRRALASCPLIWKEKAKQLVLRRWVKGLQARRLASRVLLRRFLLVWRHQVKSTHLDLTDRADLFMEERKRKQCMKVMRFWWQKQQRKETTRDFIHQFLLKAQRKALFHWVSAYDRRRSQRRFWFCTWRDFVVRQLFNYIRGAGCEIQALHRQLALKNKSQQPCSLQEPPKEEPLEMESGLEIHTQETGALLPSSTTKSDVKTTQKDEVLLRHEVSTNHNIGRDAFSPPPRTPPQLPLEVAMSRGVCESPFVWVETQSTPTPQSLHPPRPPLKIPPVDEVRETNDEKKRLALQDLMQRAAKLKGKLERREL